MFLIGFIRVSEFQLMSQERQVFTFVVGEPGLQHVIPDMALHLCEDERDAPKGHACSLGENRCFRGLGLRPS